MALLISTSANSQVTYDESVAAARVIGSWLSKSTGHYDFLSATPVGPKRAGTKFFIRGWPATQMASDYGISYSQVARDSEVSDAYEVLGFNTNGVSKTINMNRFHLALNFANKHDFTFSYLSSVDGLKGWGVGYKRVLYQYRYFYLSYRAQYGRSKKEDYFDNINVTNDLSASLYFRVIDFYAGFKHAFGSIDFEAPVPALRLPRIYYSSALNQLDYFYGIAVATSTNSRLNLQLNQFGEEFAISSKFSLWFDSLLPTASNWFRDPRHIKQ